MRPSRVIVATQHNPQFFTMRILAFSDLHRDGDAADVIVRASVDADVVVGVGDFATRGEGGLDLLEHLAELTCPLILVTGNHDRRAELVTHCAEHSAIHLLDGSSVTVAGITFFGLGGEIPRRSNTPWNETMDENAARAVFATAPVFDVLVVHTPPHGHCDRQRDGAHEGSSAVREAIEARSPALCLCGHIHHAWGSIEHLGSTTVHNLGPRPSWHTFSGRSLDD